jgi:hypothetical protein
VPSPFMFGPCQPCCQPASGRCDCIINAPAVYAQICSECDFWNNTSNKLSRGNPPNDNIWGAAYPFGAQQNNVPPFGFINLSCNPNDGSYAVTLNCYDNVGATFGVALQSCVPFRAVASGYLPYDFNSPSCCGTGTGNGFFTVINMSDTPPTGLCTAQTVCCSGVMPGLLRVTFTTDQSPDCPPCISSLNGVTYDLRLGYNSFPTFYFWTLPSVIWPCGASGNMDLHCGPGIVAGHSVWKLQIEIKDTGIPPQYDNFYTIQHNLFGEDNGAPCQPVLIDFQQNLSSLSSPCSLQAVVTQ